MYLKDATIVVNAGNDGIKTDVEASTAEEGDALTKDIYSGYMYIVNSSLDVTSVDDGISVNSYLDIENGNINVVANGGAPSTITESSSDAADGKGIKVGGIALVDDAGNETDLASQTDYNYLLKIAGGTVTVNSNDDAVHSNGNIYLAGAP